MKYSRYPEPKEKVKRPSLIRVFIRRHSFKIKCLYLTFLLLGALGLFYYLFFYKDTFKINRIEISGPNKFVNLSDVKKLTEGYAISKNIFVVNLDVMKKNLSDAFLAAKGFGIKRIFPSALKVKVEERSPMALVSSTKDGKLYMVDDEGFVLGLVEGSFLGLPRVTYEGDVMIGHFIDKNVVPVYLELLDGLKREDLKASSMSINDKYSNIFLENNIAVLIGNDKDKENAFKSIAALIKKLGLEGKKLRKIDLRYDKVIVLYD